MLQCPRCGRQFPDNVHVCPDDLTPLRADDTNPDVPVDPLIGRVFDGKYRLDEQLGGGGMGTVYRATHLMIERPVAIKVLNQRFVGDQTAQERFRREARAAGRMHHPNAVTVTDFGTTEDGWLYIVMELLEGRTLRDLLAHEAPLDPARAVSFMLQACSAVGAAHDANLIHRDLKPANIFIEQRPNMPAVAKVLDFGVAKFAVEEHEDDDYKTLTQVGAIIGTPRYMSPEQCSGAAPLTPASDVYSLGIILYEMLTGAVPFSAETPLALAMKQVTEAPRPPREVIPSIPKELETVVLHALAKQAADRPPDANEFRRELHATAEDLGLEHADSTVTPTMDALRHAGTQSPSGRLVIDLATLRQVQAASSGESDGAELATGAASKRGFGRMKVPMEKQGAAQVSHRGRVVVAAMIALVAIVAVLGIGYRWRHSSDPVSASQTANPNVAAPVAAVASPTQSASPSPSPSATTNQPRDAKNQPRKENKKESKNTSFWGRVKRRIFK
ncbi:MAG TPA: serine/threonine-protein kinase [Pyrinomonadaceae bacterium]|nr:serine/threonine-protein kinase [Pyrinomonadaceae bacterium]